VGTFAQHYSGNHHAGDGTGIGDTPLLPLIELPGNLGFTGPTTVPGYDDWYTQCLRRHHQAQQANQHQHPGHSYYTLNHANLSLKSYQIFYSIFYVVF